ncbi:MAG: GNAT family N-acetyltransferase [Candidatus Hodarchaeota archaeon]
MKKAIVKMRNSSSMPLSIETPRLLIRNFRDQDIDDIVEFSSDEDYDLVRNLDWEPTVEGVKRYFESHRDIVPGDYPNWLTLIIELKVERKVVGVVGIGFKEKEKRQAMIGWLLGVKHQRQGIATEAVKSFVTYCFRNIGLHRIFARTGRSNTRSWRLMERIGMRREAHFRESHKVYDQWDDEFIYAILSKEWKLS